MYARSRTNKFKGLKKNSSKEGAEERRVML